MTRDVIIRPWDPGRDRAAVLALNSTLQDYERSLRPSRRPGPECTEEILSLIETRLAAAGDSRGLLVAEMQGRILGFITYREGLDVLEQDQREMHIPDLVVVEDARGTGVGTALIDQVRILARDRGIHRLTISVLAQNRAAQGVYERYGFRLALRTYEMNTAQ